jgi:hypothetical protein
VTIPTYEASLDLVRKLSSGELKRDPLAPSIAEKILHVWKVTRAIELRISAIRQDQHRRAADEAARRARRELSGPSNMAPELELEGGELDSGALWGRRQPALTE